MSLHLYFFALEAVAIIFAAGGAWNEFRNLRKSVAHLRRDQILTDARFRRIIVTLTIIAAHLPNNPGGRVETLEAVKKLSEDRDE